MNNCQRCVAFVSREPLALRLSLACLLRFLPRRGQPKQTGTNKPTVFVWSNKCMYIFIYICIYIYVYGKRIYIYIYIYIYVYRHMCTYGTHIYICYFSGPQGIHGTSMGLKLFPMGSGVGTSFIWIYIAYMIYLTYVYSNIYIYIYLYKCMYN